MTGLDAISRTGWSGIGMPRARRIGVRTDAASAAPLAAPRLQLALERRRLWERRYARRLLWSDAVIVVCAVFAAFTISSVVDPASAAGEWPRGEPVLVAAVWLAMLAALRTREPSIVGSGPAEYKRVANASGIAFGVIAIAWAVLQLPTPRTQLLVALPVGLTALIICRHTWRRWLNLQRRHGHYTSRTIVAGNRDDIEYVIRMLRREGSHSHVVLGAATFDGSKGDVVVDGRSYPVVGTARSVATDARQLGADSVVVASRLDDQPEYIKRLSWELEGTAAELILSSSLTDVAGPRITLEPLDGLPLIHVKIPQFEGGRHVLKRGMDIVLSAIALTVIALAVPVIAVLILLDDGRPVFFRQTRIGRDGREFPMLKFRTMRSSAEAELGSLLTANEGAGPMFKLRQDPRVTRVGRYLRRYSLDELPQFWNVLRGEMSVVGPRPPLPREVTSYDGAVRRRLFINPGITGLWQVSGRADLSWDESVRLDLLYVENWSAMTDLMIMWRTARVIMHPKGAY